MLICLNHICFSILFSGSNQCFFHVSNCFLSSCQNVFRFNPNPPEENSRNTNNIDVPEDETDLPEASIPPVVSPSPLLASMFLEALRAEEVTAQPESSFTPVEAHGDYREEQDNDVPEDESG